jgi:hypothetical protein
MSNSESQPEQINYKDDQKIRIYTVQQDNRELLLKI